MLPSDGSGARRRSPITPFTAAELQLLKALAEQRRICPEDLVTELVREGLRAAAGRQGLTPPPGAQA